LILLDENIVEEQRLTIRAWKKSIRQVGYEVGRKGLKDYEVIPVLRHLRNATFLTCDRDYYKSKLCNAKYCLVWFDIPADQFATYARMFLSHPYFQFQRNRLGKIIRVHATGINWIDASHGTERFVDWMSK
jgi:hypothetical protein